MEGVARIIARPTKRLACAPLQSGHLGRLGFPEKRSRESAAAAQPFFPIVIDVYCDFFCAAFFFPAACGSYSGLDGS